MPYIFYNLGKKLTEKLSRIKHKWFLLLVISIIGLSAKAAIYYDSVDNSAAQDMATGAFSGGIISFIILLYEQFREDERDKKQLALANNSLLVNTFLREVVPTYQRTFGFVSELHYYPPEETELVDVLSRFSTLIVRTKNEQLKSESDEFMLGILHLSNVVKNELDKNPKSNFDIPLRILNLDSQKKNLDEKLENLYKEIEKLLQL